MAELRGGGGARRAERGRERASLGEEEQDGQAWALGPLAWSGGSPLVIAGDVNADWPWQGVSGGRQASLVPGRTSWHISQCVKDSRP